MTLGKSGDINNIKFEQKFATQGKSFLDKVNGLNLKEANLDYIGQALKDADTDNDKELSRDEFINFTKNSDVFKGGNNVWLQKIALNSLGLEKSLDEVASNPTFAIRGDSVAAIFASIGAAEGLKSKSSDGKVLLIRPDKGFFGGVLTKGNLCYLDRNLRTGASEGIWAKFLKLAGVENGDMCLVPDKADAALQLMLLEAGVQVVSGTSVTNIETEDKNGKKIASLELSQGSGSPKKISPKYVIEADGDLEIPDKLGIKTDEGLPEINEPNKTLSVSPVFTISNMTAADIQNIEKNILKSRNLMDAIKEKIRRDWPDKRQAEDIIKDLYKLTYSPPGADYADMQSYLLSAYYCLKTGKKFDLLEPVFLDKGNLAINKKNKTISFNGLLINMKSSEIAQLERDGKKPTKEMLDEMKSLESFFKNEVRNLGNTEEITITPPETLYIRHSRSMNPAEVVDPVTLEEVQKGQAGRGYTYNLDYRGPSNPTEVKKVEIGFHNTDAYRSKNFSNLGVVGDGAAVPVGLARLAEFNSSSAYEFAKKVAGEIS